MLGRVFNFWISVISKWVEWIFTLKINENPDITIGTFLLGCATIGIAIYFVLGTGIIGNMFNGASKSVSSTKD